jgi:hypothetical protein
VYELLGLAIDVHPPGSTYLLDYDELASPLDAVDEPTPLGNSSMPGC